MSCDLEVIKTFKRKCENSTQSNKKCQKIYHPHDDHSYTKNFTLNLVNDDCLSEIFMYVPVCERPKIAQVCKKWNIVFYAYCFKVKKLVLSHWEYDYPQNSLEKFITSEKKLSFLRSLLDKYCTYLTELDLVAYDNSNIVPLLNESYPNLVKLRLRLKYPFDNKELENAFSRMPELRVLKIIFRVTPEIPYEIIASLKNVANTLNELIIIGQSKDIFKICTFPNSFSTIIPQLKALKIIELGGMLITSCISKAIADAKLNFYRHEHIYSKRRFIGSYLPNVKDLSLDEKYEITDDILYNIANSFKSLNYLITNCSLVTDVGIQAITKMKHLECLFLTGKNHVTDYPLKLLKGLKQLELPDSYKITNNSIEKILENSPYIDEISFKNTSITPEFLKIVEKVSEERKINISLYVQFSNCCVGVIQSQYLFVHCVCKAIHLRCNTKSSVNELFKKKINKS